MVQRQKEDVRARLLAAAREVFAEVGFDAATIAAVAVRAGVSTGNVYRYFDGKQALLDAALPPALAHEFRALVRKRVDALASARDIALLPSDSEYYTAADRLFEFCIEQRHAVVFLLSGARGTRFESFAETLARDLERWALGYARRAYPELQPSPALRSTLSEVYRSYVDSLARALATHQRRAALEDVVAHLSAYHLGGMKQLFETALRPARERRRRPAAPRRDPVR